MTCSTIILATVSASIFDIAKLSVQCREVSTPIDIMYEIPPNVKTSPKNQWIWELKERMEEAHEKVRQNTRTCGQHE
jgi:hypothetical protein